LVTPPTMSLGLLNSYPHGSLGYSLALQHVI
jgi:hypothetical protein